jgi:hypothetical protein
MDFRILPRRKGGGPRWATGVLSVPRAGELTEQVIGLAIDVHRNAHMHEARVMNYGAQAYRASSMFEFRSSTKLCDRRRRFG